MATFSNTPRPAYVYEAATDQWIPVGFGPHTHAVTDVTNAFNTTTVTTKGDLVVAAGSNNITRLAAGTNGDALVPDSSTATGLRWQGNFAAGKNKVINGDFGIWQRGTSFSSINGIYTADRWIGATNKTVTISQQTFTAGTAPVSGYEGTYFLRIAQSASGSYCAVQTRLEDVRLFAGQTITLSFWAKADATVANRAGIVQIFGTGGSANVDNYSSSYNITTSWARYTYTIALGSISGKTIGTNSYLNIQPILTEDALAHTIDIWGVQLEAGSVPTAFQTATGTIQGELAACQRYFANVVPSTADYGTVISMFQATSGSTAKGGIRFPVPMRTSASITLANANNFTLANASYTPIGGSSFTYAIGNTVDCRIDMSVASGLTAGNATALSGNTANLLIQASAEL